MIEDLSQESTKAGLKMNMRKSKKMLRGPVKKLAFAMKMQTLEIVQEVVHIPRTATHMGEPTHVTDICRRMNMAAILNS